MKKFKSLLAIAVIVFITACNSDDNPPTVSPQYGFSSAYNGSMLNFTDNTSYYTNMSASVAGSNPGWILLANVRFSNIETYIDDCNTNSLSYSTSQANENTTLNIIFGNTTSNEFDDDISNTYNGIDFNNPNNNPLPNTPIFKAILTYTNSNNNVEYNLAGASLF